MAIGGTVSAVRTGLRDLFPLAERHGGLFTTRQAHRVGVSDRMLTYYTRRGDLERVAHGVYRLAHLPRHRHEDIITACLWAGGDAVASHDTALVVYGLTDAMPVSVHVSTPRAFRGRRSGVVVHRAPLTDAERSVRDDVPVTEIARTLSDVAERNRDLARQAVDEALQRGEISARRLRRAAERYPALTSALRSTVKP